MWCVREPDRFTRQYTIHTGVETPKGLLTSVNPAPVKPSQPFQTLADKYPKYHKTIPLGMDTIDVYAVHRLFNIQDPSGAIQHASKKLLLSGVRTGGKTKFQDN
mgnify:CR=1 FL=1